MINFRLHLRVFFVFFSPWKTSWNIYLRFIRSVIKMNPTRFVCRPQRKASYMRSTAHIKGEHQLCRHFHTKIRFYVRSFGNKKRRHHHHHGFETFTMNLTFCVMRNLHGNSLVGFFFNSSDLSLKCNRLHIDSNSMHSVVTTSYLTVDAKYFPIFHCYSACSVRQCVCVCVIMLFECHFEPFTQWKLFKNVRVIVSYFMLWWHPTHLLSNKWMRMRWHFMCLYWNWNRTLFASQCLCRIAFHTDKRTRKKAHKTKQQHQNNKNPDSM